MYHRVPAFMTRSRFLRKEFFFVVLLVPCSRKCLHQNTFCFMSSSSDCLFNAAPLPLSVLFLSGPRSKGQEPLWERQAAMRERGKEGGGVTEWLSGVVNNPLVLFTGGWGGRRGLGEAAALVGVI